MQKSFRQLGFENARRHLEYQDGEANGIDLANTGRFKVQCKRHKDYVSISKINEVVSSGNDIPLLITKGDRKVPMVVLRWDDFKMILADIGEAYED